ncbi:hypothetical protein B0H19DRAFT_523239 [Mycena capillaripes]|nr:hypothetical protein B0H19DRAFT_523239 [Mycena capillaripes]
MMEPEEANENENPGHDATRHITAAFSKISQLLSSQNDHEAALQSLTVILDNKAAKEDIRRCRGAVALQILDLFETILPKLNSNPLRKRLLRLSSRLAEASQQMPSNSFLQNIIWEPHARSGGGYGDVYKATYRNTTVAVKSFRIRLDHRSNWPALDGVSITT